MQTFFHPKAAPPQPNLRAFLSFPRRRESRQRAPAGSIVLWIPAFAGMTHDNIELRDLQPTSAQKRGC